jgi:hypothetical protein
MIVQVFMRLGHVFKRKWHDWSWAFLELSCQRGMWPQRYAVNLHLVWHPSRHVYRRLAQIYFYLPVLSLADASGCLLGVSIQIIRLRSGPAVRTSVTL